MAEHEHECSKCKHIDKWKTKESILAKGKLRDVFFDVAFNEINGGDEKKFRAWLAKYATKNQKEFMKELAKLEPKELKVEQTKTLNYIKIGGTKKAVPKNLPVVTEGEGLENLGSTPTDQIN